MDSVARIHVAWELKQAGQKAEYIAERVGVNRATVYRWWRGIRQRGIKSYIRHHRQAKKGHRHRRAHSLVEQRVLALRREHHECCGEKIVYWLAQEGTTLSRSTMYRILNKHLQLRPKGRKNTIRGPLACGSGPREVIQMDSIDFGDVFAFTALDIFSREGQVVLRPGLTAQDGEAALRVFMAYFGPLSHHSDRRWFRVRGGVRSTRFSRR